MGIYSVERPDRGIVMTVPPASLTVTVKGSDCTCYAARFLNPYTPAVGDSVALGWMAGEPYILGKLGSTP